MYGNPIHQVYIAEGFLDDCEELIQKCLQKQDIIDFQSFCLTWKEMKLGSLYQGRNSGPEIAELSEEVLQIAKHYMVANTSNYEESVAGLFLVYSLLNLQPYNGFAALRLVPEDVPAVSRLEAVARRERRYDVLYILAAVLIKGPCQYHAADRERGMEAPLKKYLDGFRSIDSVRGVRPKGVFFRQNGELDVIRELGSVTKNYSNAKAAVIGGPSDRSLHYIDKDIAIGLNSSLRKIIGGCIDEDEEDNEDEVQDNVISTSDHHNAVEAIKAKAMKNTVNPMRHLTGIQDRKNNSANFQQWRSSSEIKTNPGRIKKSSPTKANTTSPSKRRPSPKGSPKGNINKKPKTELIQVEKIKVEDSSDTELLQVEFFPDCVSDDYCEYDSDDDSSIADNQVDFSIDSIPALIRAEDNGDVYEVEIIEPLGEREAKREVTSDEHTSVGTKHLSLPDLSGFFIDKPRQLPVEVVAETSSNQIKEDYRKFQMAPDRVPERSLKKTHLKSKLKRLGTLSVANMEEPQ